MRWFVIFVFVLLTGCDYDDFPEPEVFQTPELPVATITVAQLRDFYASGGVTTFSRDYNLTLVVTSDDRAGNFFRTFFAQDATGGVEIKAGMYELFTLYPVGRQISVSLKGATVGYSAGAYQLGLRAPKGSGYEVDYFAHQFVTDRYVLRGAVGNVMPQIKTVAELTPQLSGCLITIKNLTLTGAGEDCWATTADKSPTGFPLTKNVAATDPDGRMVEISTSGYADFAGERLPRGRVSVTGILFVGSKNFTLKIRDLNDIAE